MRSKREANWEECRSATFDVCVIGGGITGSGAARDAALRGLSTLLVDKGDFAAGTSSRSGKLIHGGLRYLKYFHFRLVFEASRERRLLLRTVAPHLVRPMRFILPFYRESRTPRWLVALGLLLYDLLALYRNIGRFRFLSRADLEREEPSLRKESRGALEYWDCTCLDTRLVIDTLKSAENAGARVMNYARLKSAREEEGGWVLEVEDAITATIHLVRARTVLNATGVWADEVLALASSTAEPRFRLKSSYGVHIVVPRERLALRNTLGLEVPRDGRSVYIVPWAETVLVGTTDNYYDGDKDRLSISLSAIDYLIEMLNHYFPDARIGRGDIVCAFAGIRPLIGSDEGVKEDKVARDYRILVDPRGMVSITGGKLTTYRLMAERAVNELVRHFFSARALSPCRTRLPLLQGKAPQELRRPADLRRAVEDAVADEHVETLCDLLIRRWGAYLIAWEGLPVDEASRLLAELKGWSEERRQAELVRYAEERGGASPLVLK